MKKRPGAVKKTGLIADFIAGYLLKHREIAEDIFRIVFPDKHLHKNPLKKRGEKI